MSYYTKRSLGHRLVAHSMQSSSSFPSSYNLNSLIPTIIRPRSQLVISPQSKHPAVYLILFQPIIKPDDKSGRHAGTPSRNKGHALLLIFNVVSSGIRIYWSENDPVVPCFIGGIDISDLAVHFTRG